MNHVVSRYGVEIDCSYEHRTQCPKCANSGADRSQDNLKVYGLDSDGRHRGAKCFSCSFAIPSVEWLEENGEVNEDEWEDIMGLEFDDEVHAKLKQQTGVDSKNYRAIPTSVSKWFGVRYEYDEESGDVVKTFYPTTQNNELVGYKVRKHPKDFSSPFGETGLDCDLFMQFRFKNSKGRYVVVTSGEHDALAAFTMLKEYNDNRGNDYGDIPVVSATVGESGTHKQLQGQFEWLNNFERVIFVPDPDKAGKAALDKVAKVVPKGKLFVMTLPLKDPNDMLQQGRQKEFIKAFYEAKPYVPSGIKGSGSLMEDVIKSAKTEKIPLPPFMHKLQKMMAGGIPLGVIVNMLSASGTGKSTIVEEEVYFWIFNSPYKIGILSLESDAGEYGTKILSRHVGRKINLIEDVEEKLAYLESEYVQDKSKELFSNPDGTDRFILLDDQDGSLEVVKDLIMQMVVQCGCKVIVIDPLQDLIASLSNEEQEEFMTWQKGLVKSHKVTFVNISHARKSASGAQANSTGADLSEEDIHGSSSIFKSAAANLVFTRNKESECFVERNTTLMKMTKCRWTGNTSPYAGKYFYDNESHTIHDYDTYMEENPHMKPIKRENS